MMRRAVVFEDNDLTRFTLRVFFNRRGYEVFAFPGSGVCPLYSMRKCPCPGDTCCADLIISDVNMLDGNGINLLERLIQKGCKQRHFALMSGNLSDADIARVSKVVDCAFFTKPLDMTKVTAWVEALEGSIPLKRTLFNWA